MVFGFLTFDNSLFRKPQVPAAINAALSMHRAAVEARLSKQINTAVSSTPDATFADAADLVCNVEGAWDFLEAAQRQKILSFIQNGPKDEMFGISKAMSKISGLIATVKVRFEVLGLDDLAEAIEAYGIGEIAKDRALMLLQQSSSFERTNSVFLKAVLPLFDFLTKDDILRIVRMPIKHDSHLIGAHQYKVLLKK
jgi:hypothetical protein